MTELPTVLVSRRPRTVGVDWTGARSWFGGAPRLGSKPWPRGRDGRPLHFAAQIDLAEVAAKTGVAFVPKTGSLAFFIGGDGAVIFVPDGPAQHKMLPPADTPELSVSGGSAEWQSDLDGRRLYPYWPIDFTALDVPAPPLDPSDDDYDRLCNEYHSAKVAAIERQFTRCDSSLSAALAFAGPPIPQWWQIALHLSEKLQKSAREAPDMLRRTQDMIDYALRAQVEARPKGAAEVKKAAAAVAMYEKQLASLHQTLPHFLDFSADVAAWTDGRDPWAIMSSDDWEKLVAIAVQHREFSSFTLQYGSRPDYYLKDQMFRALPAAGTAAFAALLKSVQALLDAKRAPRPHWWHGAMHFAQCLETAARIGIPSVSKAERNQLEADRKKLAQLRPRGGLATLWRTTGDRTKEVADLEARIARMEANLDARPQLEDAFRKFVSDTTTWAAGHDVRDVMEPAAIEQLEARLTRAQTEFQPFARYYAPASLEELLTVTIRALATADDRGYATLPEAVRAVINREHLLPPGAWHQMFGTGVSIQDAASVMREEGYIMLLQLTYDHLMAWSFGDCGAYQYWILPEDFAKGNWGAARMTAESH